MERLNQLTGPHYILMHVYQQGNVWIEHLCRRSLSI